MGKAKPTSSLNAVSDKKGRVGEGTYGPFTDCTVMRDMDEAEVKLA